ncbi:hypothetical protein DHOM_04970 [Dermabacter hominis 1368]|uniref:Uncharacterized protein n=1 Tax=Dermabacter hominis 1368 TaxID=1450519 RepID=A0ABR4SK54_9MICO|nr:hypothetical protein DHOM_04970 [Dermabacter hominis 1368]
MDSHKWFGIDLDLNISIEQLEVWEEEDRVGLVARIGHDASPENSVAVNVQHRKDDQVGVGTGSINYVPQSFAFIDKALDRWFDRPRGTFASVKKVFDRALAMAAVLDTAPLKGGVGALNRQLAEQVDEHRRQRERRDAEAQA